MRATGAGSRFGLIQWTEGCSQAFGVLRPMMVLSAKVQSRSRAVSSVPFSNPWTFGHPCALQALTDSAGDIGSNLSICPAPVTSMTSYRHEMKEVIGLHFPFSHPSVFRDFAFFVVLPPLLRLHHLGEHTRPVVRVPLQNLG
jgi:hypothetical protein